MDKKEISSAFIQLQNDIIAALENTDGKGKFRKDVWTRAEGGGGITAIIQDGNILEKGGVNFSEVEGPMHDKVGKMLGISATEFYATGVSIVIHPKNPFVPIIHMNIRYFEVNTGEYWFGGGIDLTPHYIVKEQAQYFHQQLKETCDKTDTAFYSKFKIWADDYFFIPHRNETRGIGGIFFDRLNDESTSYTKEKLFEFVMNVGKTFAPVYTHLMKINAEKPFNEDNKRWQLLRRGRYVEFNLVYDKGTRFGLETGGRIESILMSLPAQASWEYDVIPQKNSPEALTSELLVKGVNWLELS
jgi:coproporphyrinogen III oxidase